jgi:hypothetical protein
MKATRNYLKLAAHRAPEANWLVVICMMAAICLVMFAPQPAFAADSIFNFPIVDEFMCGFISYSRGKLAPMIAVGVIVFAIIGHWLGMSKMWGSFLYVGIGFGVIMGIVTAFGRYGSMPASCLA